MLPCRHCWGFLSSHDNHPGPLECDSIWNLTTPLKARFMGPTWGPSGADRTQVGPMLSPWTLLYGTPSPVSVAEYGDCRIILHFVFPSLLLETTTIIMWWDRDFRVGRLQCKLCMCVLSKYFHFTILFTACFRSRYHYILCKSFWQHGLILTAT